MESKESKNYRLWKEDTLANQTSHHVDKREVVVKEMESKEYVVELAPGWR
jgi:hypothetical protein